ncbi:FecR family protein [Mangrovibacterium sp.]|uniref:FecR family protein n=1 Tax=Mangrovibacterium sp. TaxID=1961364 RepID=UPI0035657166
MEKIFVKYLNGTCTPDEYLLIVEILRNSKNSMVLNDLMRESWDTLKPQVDAPSNTDLLGRIHRQIALSENKQPAKTIRLYKISLRLAAVLIIGLFTTLAFFYNSLYLSAGSELTNHFSSPAGAKANIELPDGSNVWLNSESEIAFSANFNNNRKVELKGEAYFDVKKNASTFIVNTTYGDIHVFGTEFNVKAYPNENFITTLEQGSLEVNTKSGKKTLKPGEQAFLNVKNQLQVQAVEVGEFVSWKDGKLIFVRKPLVEVVKMLERWYNVKIELDLKETKNLWFTGTIEMETISEVLGIIEITLPIEYTYDKKTRIIKIKVKKHNA